MIAAEYREMAAVIGELACLDLLHPGAIHTQGHVMLRLARHRARMATDALAIINEKAKSHSGSCAYQTKSVAQLYNSACFDIN